MIINSYDFYKGEKRYINSHIQPLSPDEVTVVTSAAYKVKKDGETVDEGSLTVDGLEISMLFDADETGSYELIEYVTVGAETFVTVARIDVR